MAKQYHIASTQKFNSTGKIGIGILLGAPLLASICYYWLTMELNSSFGGNPLVPALCLVLCFIANLASIPLLLIGREQRHIAREVELQKGDKGLWM